MEQLIGIAVDIGVKKSSLADWGTHSELLILNIWTGTVKDRSFYSMSHLRDKDILIFIKWRYTLTSALCTFCFLDEVQKSGLQELLHHLIFGVTYIHKSTSKLQDLRNRIRSKNRNITHRLFNYCQETGGWQFDI